MSIQYETALNALKQAKLALEAAVTNKHIALRAEREALDMREDAEVAHMDAHNNLLEAYDMVAEACEAYEACEDALLELEGNI